MMTEPDQNYVSQSPETDDEGYILEINNLKKFFPIKGGIWKRIVGQVYAVNGVSFKIKKGETIGVVGESGCGKTTLGRTILNLIPITSGEIIFKGKNIAALNKTREERKLKRKKLLIGSLILIIGLSFLFFGVSTIALEGGDIFSIDEFLSVSLDTQIIIILCPTIGVYLIYKGAVKLSALSPMQLMLRRQMQIVFQDPYASLNPRMTIRGTLSEPLKVHKIIPEDIELEEPEAPIPDIDDLGVSLVDLKEVEEQPKKKKIVLVSPEKALVLEPSEVDKTGRQKRELVFDEHQGKVVAKRKRKSGRRRPEWEEFDNIDNIEVDDIEVDDIEVDDIEVDDLIEEEDIEVDDLIEEEDI